MAYFYEIYGLTLQSDIPLNAPAELSIASVTRGRQHTDISIVLTDVASEPPPALKKVAAFAAINNKQFWLDVPQVARFFAVDSETIHVQPYEQADNASVELYLLGSVLGPVVNLRKQLVMHGNVVQLTINDQLVRLLICGHSAVGKSTFSAYLMKHHNAQLVADDLAIFNAQGQVLVGSPRLKIWQDVAQVLNIHESELTPIRPQLKKFDWHLPATESIELAPIDLVIILTGDNQDDENNIDEFIGAQKLLPLQHQIFRKQFTQKADLEAVQFMLIAKHLGNTPVIKLGRPRTNKIVANLQSMSDRLFAYMHENLKKQKASKAESVHD